jgi:hypothetical protein
MRAGISIAVTPEDRRRLEVMVGDCKAKQKHSKRAKVILGDGRSVRHQREIMRLRAIQSGFEKKDQGELAAAP